MRMQWQHSSSSHSSVWHTCMSLLLSCCANWKCSPGDDAVYALNSACSPFSYSSKTAAPSKPSSYLCITPSITCKCDAHTLCTLPKSWTCHLICWKQPLAYIPQHGINSQVGNMPLSPCDHKEHSQQARLSAISMIDLSFAWHKHTAVFALLHYVYQQTECTLQIEQVDLRHLQP